MLRNQFDQLAFSSAHAKLKDSRSRSFGCEKDLNMGHKPIEITTSCKRDNNKPKTKRIRHNKPKANKPKKSNDNVHPLFNEAANLNYIDDEDSCCDNNTSKPVNIFIKQIEDENEEEEEEEEEEDEDNVIYEGDSNDENDENKEFLNVLDEDDDDDDDKTIDEEDEMNLEDFIENEDELKCRSAPITPARLSPMLLSSNSNSSKDNCKLSSTSAQSNHVAKNECSSFVYNMNLYDDKTNFILLNNQDEFNKRKSKLKSNKSNLDSSSSSLNKIMDFKLEPLVIEEEKDKSPDAGPLTPTNANRNESTELLTLSTESTSTPVGSSTSPSNSESSQLAANSYQSCDSSEDCFVYCENNNNNKESSEEKLEVKEEEEDENSQVLSTSSTTTGLLSESQFYLKDNYEKAKRERQIEQEQAEMEKKRLQEILDICMEFQRQEEAKSTSTDSACSKTKHQQQQKGTLVQSVSVSSSISSSSNSGNATSATQPAKLKESTTNDSGNNTASPLSSSSSSSSSKDEINGKQAKAGGSSANIASLPTLNTVISSLNSSAVSCSGSSQGKIKSGQFPSRPISLEVNGFQFFF